MSSESDDISETSRTRNIRKCSKPTEDLLESKSESNIREKRVDGRNTALDSDGISETRHDRESRKNRIGTVGIIVDDVAVSDRINEILHQYAYLIVGRLGIPYRSRGVSVISVVVDGTMEDISAMTGRLGKVAGVSVKAAVSKR